MTDQGQALTANTEIEGFRIEKILGEGGFGITYLAYDIHLDKHIALKEYLPSDFAVRATGDTVIARTEKSQADYDWGLKAFLDEARMLAKFKHPNIVMINRFFHANGTAYIVMDYAGERTLEDLLKETKKLNEEEVLFILKHLIDGLKEVHQQNVYHRDIKPANIIIQDDGSPVLIDFGAARQIIETKSRSITTLLTPGYAPIEQYSNKGKIGAWTDIYALAAIAYTCLTGERPDDATERVEEDEVVPAVIAAKGQGSLAFLRAVDQGFSVFAKARPASLEQWWALLVKDQKSVPKAKQKQPAADYEQAERRKEDVQDTTLVGYLSIKEFSQHQEIPIKRITRLIQEGFYTAKMHDGDCYISREDLAKQPPAIEAKKNGTKKYIFLSLFTAAAIWGGIKYQEHKQLPWEVVEEPEYQGIGDFELEEVSINDSDEAIELDLPEWGEEEEVDASTEEEYSENANKAGAIAVLTTAEAVQAIHNNMLDIPAECFHMGSPAGEIGRDVKDERQHIMCVEDFQMGAHEVSVGEFRAFVAATGYRTQAEDNIEKQGCYSYKESDWGWHTGIYWDNMEFDQEDNHPVVCVSWHDAQKFIAWLNDNNDIGTYRLPTEVEWEYSARAGTKTRYFWSEAVDAAACRYANVNDKSWSSEFPCEDNYKYTSPVAHYQPNDFGLYDISGNVWEWTCTQYESKYLGGEEECMFAAEAQRDNFFVVRGGSYNSVTRWLRVAVRSGDRPWERDSDRGFRLVRIK